MWAMDGPDEERIDRTIDGILAELSMKQRKFVLAYMGPAKGNAREAARTAGYKHVRTSAWDCVQNSKIMAALEEIQRADPLIASRTERQRALTRIIRDRDTSRKDKVAALNLLSKISGDFVRRVEAEVRVTSFSDLIKLAGEGIEE